MGLVNNTGRKVFSSIPTFSSEQLDPTDVSKLNRILGIIAKLLHTDIDHNDLFNTHNLTTDIDHNELDGLQGGTTDEYYHLTAADYTELSEWLDDVTLGSGGGIITPGTVTLTGNNLEIKGGNSLVLYDSTNNDTWTIYHDGSNILVSSSPEADLLISSDVATREGKSLRAYNSANDKNADLAHNGSGAVLSTTSGYAIIQAPAGQEVRLQAGGLISMQDSDDSYATRWSLDSSSGDVTMYGNLVIPDAGYVGSSSDTDALQIEADGDVVLTQSLGVGVTPAEAVHVKVADDAMVRVETTTEGANGFAGIGMYAPVTTGGSLAANTISVLRFDSSDTTDTAGNYTWYDYNETYEDTMTDGATYRTTVGGQKDTIHFTSDSTADYIGINSSGADNSSNVSETIQTAQFYFEYAATAGAANYILGTSTPATYWVAKASAYLGTAGGNWYFYSDGTTLTVTTGLAINTVHHLAFVWDGTDIKAYVNGVLSDDATESWQPAAQRWTLGCHPQGGLWGQSGYYDQFRIQDADTSGSGFPSEDTAAGTTVTELGRVRWDDNADQLEIDTSDENKDILLDAGTGTVKTASNFDVTGNIVVSGTVDGIDIATDVAANTAKVTATREFFVPAAYITGTNNPYTTKVGQFPVSQRSSAEEVLFTFCMPHDYTTLTEAVIVVIPDATETIQWDITVAVAAVGEDYNNNEVVGSNITKAVTINDMTELDISSQMANAVADDYVGVKFESDTSNIRAVGIRIKYT